MNLPLTTTAGLTVAVFLTVPGLPTDLPVMTERPFVQFADTEVTTHSNVVAGGSSRSTPWNGTSSSVLHAVIEAQETGTAVGKTAAQLAYSIAARINVPGAPLPAVSDNELGGIVFMWKGFQREIQVEVDPDGTYFVRVKDSSSVVRFVQEGFGEVPLTEVIASLREWSAERTSRMLGAPLA